MTDAPAPRRRPRGSREALTKHEAEQLEAELGRPITWPPVHHHGNPNGMFVPADDDGVTNQIAPKGNTL